MAAQFNGFDLVVVLIIAAVGFIGFRRGIFEALFDFVRFFLAYFLSLLGSVPIVSSFARFNILQNVPLAVFIQGFLFIIAWFFLGYLRVAFDNVLVMTVGKTGIFYKLHRYLGILPGVAIGFIAVLLLFSIPLLLPADNQFHQLAANSFWGTQIAPKIYGATVSFNNTIAFDPYNGLFFKMTPAAYAASNSEADRQRSLALLIGGNPSAVQVYQQINAVREASGLPSLILPTNQKQAQATYDQSPSSTFVPPPTPTPTQAPLISLPVIQLPGISHPTTAPTPQPTPLPIYIEPNRTVQPATPVQTAAPVVRSTPVPTQRPSTPQPTSAPTPTPAPAPNSDIASMEQAVLVATNQLRAQNGVGPLAGDPAIAAVARAHSQDMVDNNYFAHVTPSGVTPFQRLTIGGISFYTAGENIAINYTVDAVMQAWMSDAGHRDNILNPAFGHLGVGIAAGKPNDGNFASDYYFTQDFTN